MLEGEDSLEAEEAQPPIALKLAWYEEKASDTAAAAAATTAGVVERAASSSLISKSTIVELSPKVSPSAAAGPNSCNAVLRAKFLSSPEMLPLAMDEEEEGGCMRCCPSMTLSGGGADQEEKLGSGAIMAVEGG